MPRQKLPPEEVIARRRARERERQAKIRADPEKRALDLERRRIAYRRKRLELDEPSTSPGLCAGDEQLHNVMPMEDFDMEPDYEPDPWLENKKIKIARETASNQYFAAITEPLFSCTCCERLWFKSSLVNMKIIPIYQRIPCDKIQLLFATGEPRDAPFCRTCYGDIMKSKIPNLAVQYGFKFPPLPDVLRDLNDVEERLVSPRIPYMNLVEKECKQQIGTQGTIVNVPIELQKTVTVLPRNLNDTYTIEVKLKKHMHLKSDYSVEMVSPLKVFKAMDYLKDTPLYKAHNISQDEFWMKKYVNKTFPPGSNQEISLYKEENNIKDENQNNSKNKSGNQSPPDKENEVDVEAPSLAETLILSRIYQNTKKRPIAIASDQNIVPMSPLNGTDSEELSFPKIFCGQVRYFQERDNKKSPTYLDIMRSEIRRKDRRGAIPQKVLYSYDKILRARMLSIASIMFCKKIELVHLMSCQALEPNDMQHLGLKNLCYNFMKPIKTSLGFWKQESGKLMAMIRQLGLPTLLITLSAAESHWYPLIKNLVYLHENGRELTLEEFKSMKSIDKSKLIRNDPVVCALYFHKKTDELLKNITYRYGVLGRYTVREFYKHIEFQQQGSPHYHMMFWLKDAPVYDKENVNYKYIVKFADSILSCSKDHEFAAFQIHKHSFMCRKKLREGQTCCFNFPFFPMNCTRLLIPLKEDCPYRSTKNYLKIREYLNKLELNEYLRNITFEQFLENLNMTIPEYLNAIRSGIPHPIIALKRCVDELMINAYNPDMLTKMQSSIDIQFMLDPSTAPTYLEEYMGKSNAGLSKIMRKVIETVQKQDAMPLTSEILTEYGNAFIHGKEVSAQEAAWYLLELPLSKASTDIIMIPTFPVEQRMRLLKSQEALQELNQESINVYQKSLIDQYIERPIELEDTCLAAFAAWYDWNKKDIRKRTKSRVIISVGYTLAKHPHDYYREQIMLYTHWRNEQREILNHDFQQLFESKQKEIVSQRDMYVTSKHISIIEQMLEALENNTEVNDERERKKGLQEDESGLDFDERELYTQSMTLDLMDAPTQDCVILEPRDVWTESTF